jgi:hypothetical protein
MSTESIRTTRLHRAVAEAVETMRRPAAWASIGLAAGATGVALPALALDTELSRSQVSTQTQHQRSGALLVIDSAVDDADVLLQDLPPGVRTARLPSDLAPLEGLRMLLDAHPGTRELHVLSHGAPGRLEFASGVVAESDVEASRETLSSWFAGIERPEIILYGCDVAADEEGRSFIETLARHTGARISASDDPTGAAHRGGDWTLERSTALAARAPLFGEAARAEFQGLLANFTVTNSDDSGAGSLRDAINQANSTPGPDTIDFDPGVYGSTITLTTGALFVNDDLTINGPGRDNLTIDANRNSRVMFVSSNVADMAISGLTLSNGYESFDNGGGILSQATNSLTITDSRIENNEAAYYYYYYFPVRGTDGDATVTGNTQPGTAQRRAEERGIFSCPFAGAGGGVAQEGGRLTITNTEVLNNQAKYDGGGILFCSDGAVNEVTLEDATISGNTAGGEFGFYSGDGGGVAVVNSAYTATVAITGSTVSNNTTSTDGGGLSVSSGFSPTSGGLGTVNIDSTRFEGNSAGRNGGGVFLYGQETILNRGTLSDVTITDSVITDNVIGNSMPLSPSSDRRSSQRGIPVIGLGGGLAFVQDDSTQPRSVEIRNTTISNNRGALGGGASFLFGQTGADVLMDNVTVSGNFADSAAPPIRSTDQNWDSRGPGFSGIGGGILLTNSGATDPALPGSLTLRNSTVDSNGAPNAGGGIAAGTLIGGPQPPQRAPETERGINLLSELRIENSTLSSNGAGVGGAIAVNAQGSRGIAIQNSTISGNTATFTGGAIDLASPDLPPPIRGSYAITARIDLTTIADNGVTPLRGISVAGINLSSATADLQNSILSNNGIDVDASIFADDSLIENPGKGASISGYDNLIGQDPLLGPLQDNGGVTLTHLPADGSPVIDAGDPNFTGPPDFDQRGDGFPRVQNGRVDMGSVEGVVTPPSIAIAPTTVDFGVVKVGETSSIDSVTISNTGGTLTVDSVTAAAGAFGAAGGDCGATPFDLNDGESCTLAFQFTPGSVGVASQVITVASNDMDGPDSFTLTGTGALGEISVTPDPVDFGGVLINTVSMPMTATLENIGVVDTEVTAIDAATAPFTTTGGTCGPTPFTLAPTATCTVEYTFAPTLTGPATQALDVTSDASSSPDTINLAGTGTGEASVGLSTDDFNFGTIALGAGGATLITIDNTGTLPLDISGITDPGAPFSLGFGTRGGGLCPTPPFTIPTAGSCDIQVAFNPFATGDYLATFDILSNAPSSPDTVTLRGTADEPLVIPTLSRWGLVLMGGLMGLLGWFGFRRRSPESTG